MLKRNHLLPIFILGMLCISPTLYSGEATGANNEPLYAVPPPQYPSEEEGMIFFINAAYTLWAPYQEGMFILNTNSTTTDSAYWIKPYMPVQSGFKAGFGFNTFHDGWKVDAEYTWFYNHPGIRSSSLRIPYIKYFCPWILNLVDQEVLSIDSQFTNTFQRVDLTLDRTYYVGNYLAIGPWIGLLGAWEDQHFYLFVTPTDDPDPAEPEDIRVMNQKMNWWGIGPYFGVDSSYYFLDEWAIFLAAGGSINLCVHYTAKLETNDVQPVSGILTNTGTKLTAVEPMVESTIGLRWDSFGQDWGLRVQLGWELQTWFNHNTFIKGSGNFRDLNFGQYGLYSMQGLTAKIRLNF